MGTAFCWDSVHTMEQGWQDPNAAPRNQNLGAWSNYRARDWVTLNEFREDLKTFVRTYKGHPRLGLAKMMVLRGTWEDRDYW